MIERHVGFLLTALLPVTALGVGPVSLGVAAAVVVGGLALVESARHFAVGHIIRAALVALLTSPIAAWLALREDDRYVTADLALRTLATVGVAGVTLLVLLWSRRKIGTRATVLAYAGGAVAQALVAPESWGGQPWKYAFAWPTALVVMALVDRSGRSVQAALLVALAGYSIVADFRSFAGLCLFAAFLIARQPKSTELPDRRRVVRTGVTLAVVALVLLQGGTWLAMNGYLGSSIQARTIAQTGNGEHSVLVGARPELGATLALMERSPTGMGLGVTPSASDIAIARAGIQQYGDAGDSEYINEYVLGDRVELHSIAADLWLILGPIAFWLVALIAVAIIAGLARLRSSRELSGLVALVAVVALWDLLFSPLGNLLHVVAAVALLLPYRARAPHRVESPNRGIRSPGADPSADLRPPVPPDRAAREGTAGALRR